MNEINVNRQYIESLYKEYLSRLKHGEAAIRVAADLFENVNDLLGYSAKRVDDESIKVLKNDGTEYTLSIKEDTVTCNCIGFQHRNRCKHTAFAKILTKEK